MLDAPSSGETAEGDRRFVCFSEDDPRHWIRERERRSVVVLCRYGWRIDAHMPESMEVCVFSTCACMFVLCGRPMSVCTAAVAVAQLMKRSSGGVAVPALNRNLGEQVLIRLFLSLNS